MSQQHPKNNKDYPLDRVKAIVAMNRALCGEVSPPLRAARVKWDDEIFYLYFYYDGEISEEDNESAECAATEFIACYPEYRPIINIIRLDYPHPIPQEEGETVYLRREPIRA